MFICERISNFANNILKHYNREKMAKKQIKEKSIEETLWESANKLRGSVEPSEYKHVVLSLIFLKYANDRFAERRKELVAEGKEAFADNPVFYNAKNVFYLEPESRWDYLVLRHFRW